MANRDRAGQRKVRLMTAWVGVGIVLMILGVYTTVWVIFLGAAVIGATPVFFTLRAALSPPREAKASADPHGEALPRTVGRSPSARRRTPPRRRGHD